MGTASFINSITGSASTITSANSVVTLTIPGLFNNPVQLFGYSADKAWETAAVVVSETQIGVDGMKTAGIVFNPIKQSFTFLADSPSLSIFEALYSAQRAVRDIYYIYGTIDLPSTGESYVCVKGTLEDYNAIASAAKTLSPREFSISWLDIRPA